MLRSWPLIGIDRNGEAHHVEERHRNPGRAADALLQRHHNFLKIISGDREGKNVGKVIAVRPNLPAEETMGLLGDALTEAHRMRTAQNTDTALMIIRGIENKGFKLVCVDSGESMEVRAISTSEVQTEGLSAEDAKDIVDHRDPIIEVLKTRIDEVPPKKINGKKKRGRTATPDVATKSEQDSLLQEILAKLPQDHAFQSYEVEQALRKLNRHDIADDSAQVFQMLEDATHAGLLKSIRPGVYRHVIKQAVTPVSVADPPPPPQALQTSLPLQAPPPIPQPKLPGLDMGVQKLLETVVGCGLVQDSTVRSPADRLRHAVQTLQNTVLQAITEFEAEASPLIERWTEEERLRNALRSSLLGESPLTHNNKS